MVPHYKRGLLLDDLSLNKGAQYSSAKSEVHLLGRLRKRARSLSKRCLFPGCSDRSILSHTLQAEGPLREIASDGEVVALIDTDGFNREDDYQFVMVGLRGRNHVHRFNGFCLKHDTEVFLPIEGDDWGLEHPKGLALHAYRAFVHEYDKMRSNLEWYRQILESTDVTPETKRRNAARNRLFVERLDALAPFKRKLEADVFGTSQFLVSRHFELPRLDFCCSLSVGGWTDKHVTAFPKGDQLHVLVSTPIESSAPGSVDLDQMESWTPTRILRFLSDVALRAETWFLSVGLYEEWKATGHDRSVIEMMNMFRDNPSMRTAWHEFNMFKFR